MNRRFTSFPDANSFVGDTVFSFKTTPGEWVKSISNNATSLFGYVFFRQKKGGQYFIDRRLNQKRVLSEICSYTFSNYQFHL